MNKRLWASRLGIEITAAIFAALLAAFAVFFLLSIFEHEISRKTISREYIEENTKKEVNLFQKYIDENDISSHNIKRIADWVRYKRNVMLKVYDDENKLIFDSTLFDFNAPEKNDEIKDSDERPNKNRTLYDVQFKDMSAKIEMFCFFEYRRFVYMNYMNLGIGFVVFIIILMLLIKKITDYITTLESDIKILEGGNLEYNITVKGHNELTSLAKSIDDMRISFTERLKEEENARNANHKLVTAMSHDLRTPLTVLIGLLEILDGKKYNDSSQIDGYIKKSLDKSYQIKKLSDKIFEYFLAFNLEREEMNIESYNAEVINEINEDYIFSLEEKGYKLDYKPIEAEIKLSMDINYIHRVFDNIFSNLIKYADKEMPVKIYNKTDNNSLYVFFENGIKDNDIKPESTNIGLETCRNIMAEHNGEFSAYKDGNIFRVSVRFGKDN